MDLKDLITESDKKKLKDLLQKLQVDYSPAMKSIFTDKLKWMLPSVMSDAGKLDILNRQLRTWHFSCPHCESTEANRYYDKRPNFMFFEAPAWVYLVCEIFAVDFMNAWQHWPEFLKPLQKYIMVKWVAVDWDKMVERGKGTFDTWRPGC